MNRSPRHTAAAVLVALLSLADLLRALTLLPRGADGLGASGDQPPYTVVVVMVMVSVVSLVGAYGVLRGQRWGVILTLLLMVVNMLVALPGVVFGPTTASQAGSLAAAVAAATVTYLLLRRDSRAGIPAGARP